MAWYFQEMVGAVAMDFATSNKLISHFGEHKEL